MNFFKKIVNSISKLINWIHWAQFVFSKGQFILTLLILIKVYKTTLLQKIIIIIVTIIVFLIIGYLFDRYFREDFQKKAYKNTLIK